MFFFSFVDNIVLKLRRKKMFLVASELTLTWKGVYKVQNIKSVRLPISGSNLHSRNIESSLFTRSYQKTFVLML